MAHELRAFGGRSQARLQSPRGVAHGARMERAHIGVVLMWVSTTLQAVGTVMQKRAVDAAPPFEGRSTWANARGLLARPAWLAGWVLTSVGILLNLVALGLADMTVVQPLLGFGLVVLGVLSHFWLGERVGRREVLGMAIAVGGVVWLGFTSSAPRVSEDIDTQCYLTPRAMFFYVVILASIALPWAWSRARGYRSASVVFALVSAACSVVGFTFAKGASSLVDAHGLGAALAIPAAWLCGGVFLVFTTLAIALQQLSLQKGRAVVAAPLFSLASMVLPVAPGVLVFGETLDATRIAAIGVIVLGAVVLSLPGPAHRA